MGGCWVNAVSAAMARTLAEGRPRLGWLPAAAAVARCVCGSPPTPCFLPLLPPHERPAPPQVIRDLETLWEVPAKPKGVLFVAHGCNHQGSDFWPPSPRCRHCLGLPEEGLVRAAALRRGYAVVAVTSFNRDSKCWHNTQASRSEDLQVGGRGGGGVMGLGRHRVDSQSRAAGSAQCPPPTAPPPPLPACAALPRSGCRQSCWRSCRRSSWGACPSMPLAAPAAAASCCAWHNSCQRCR